MMGTSTPASLVSPRDFVISMCMCMPRSRVACPCASPVRS